MRLRLWKSESLGLQASRTLLHTVVSDTRNRSDVRDLALVVWISNCVRGIMGSGGRRYCFAVRERATWIA